MTVRGRVKSVGFTIVELLIVIVVIAILAAVSIVAYQGLQQRARDSDVKSDLAQIAKLLHMYAADNGNYVSTGSGCGASNNGIGWFNYVNAAATYNKSIMQCLIDGGYTSTVISGSAASCGNANCRAYMKYTCTAPNPYPGTYLYANLETEPHTGTETDNTCNATIDSRYGMNYVLKVN